MTALGTNPALSERDDDEQETDAVDGALTDKLEAELELLQRHVQILKRIYEQQPIGIIRLSETLDVPQHKVRYSLRLLEQEGLITPSVDGAVISEELHAYLPRLERILEGFGETLETIETILTSFETQ